MARRLSYPAGLGHFFLDVLNQYLLRQTGAHGPLSSQLWLWATPWRTDPRWWPATSNMSIPRASVPFTICNQR